MALLICALAGCSETTTAPKTNKPSTAMKHAWSKAFGNTSGTWVSGVATDGAGDIVIAGFFEGTVDFGAGPLTSAGEDDIFVAKFSPSGACAWSKRFGDAGTQWTGAVAVDPSGNVIIVGGFYGTIDFGGGTLTSAGSMDAFVVKLDPGGLYIWSSRFGDSDVQYATGVAAAESSGNVMVAGDFLGSVDFGGGPLTSAGARDVFLVKFGPTGTHYWSKRFGDAANQYTAGIAVDPVGNVAIAGTNEGTIDLGGGPFVSVGDDDIFLAKFNAGGTHLWSRSLRFPDYHTAGGVVFDPSGNVILAGSFEGSVNLGGGTLMSAGLDDIFVAKFDPSGTHVWSKRFGDAGGQGARDVAVDPAGNVLVTGGFDSTVNFGGGVLTSAGEADILVAKLDPTGRHLWSKSFGDAERQAGCGVAADAAGNVVIVGQFNGTVCFGGDTLLGPNYPDISNFVAKFTP